MDHFRTTGSQVAGPSRALNNGRSVASVALFLGASLASCGLDEFQSGGDDETKVAVTALADPLTSKIDLGRKIFFDEQLSQPAGVSCGMCHNPSRGWGDGRPQGKGVQDHTLAGDVDNDGIIDHETTQAIAGTRFKTILTPRNTPTIYNSNIFPNLFWDGRAGDLIHQAEFPVEAGFEMNADWDTHLLPLMTADAEYVALFTDAFGDPAVTVERAIDAIGTYEDTIAVNDTPYDQYVAGDLTALSPAAEQGMNLYFGAANCSSCHPAPLLTNFEFINTGVPTAGELALYGGVDLGFGVRTDLTVVPPVQIDDPADYGKFKTGQLRMIGVTGPYMHNGAFATLEEVVEFYDAGGGIDPSGQGLVDTRLVPLGLTASEKADLVQFLREGLTGKEIR